MSTVETSGGVKLLKSKKSVFPQIMSGLEKSGRLIDWAVKFGSFVVLLAIILMDITDPLWIAVGVEIMVMAFLFSAFDGLTMTLSTLSRVFITKKERTANGGASLRYSQPFGPVHELIQQLDPTMAMILQRRVEAGERLLVDLTWVMTEVKLGKVEVDQHE